MKRAVLAVAIRLSITAAVLVVVVALVITPFALAQQDPHAVWSGFLLGPLASVRHLGNIGEIATPIAMTGLATLVLFRSGLFNLGVEGSFFLGGLGAAAAALTLPLPAPAAPLIAISGGAVVGSLACVIPGYLRIRFDAPEMVTSLILNYAFLSCGVFVLNYLLRDPTVGNLMSRAIPSDARLARLLPGTRLNDGTGLALAACVGVGIWLYLTRSGLNTRLVGASPEFAAHLGLKSSRIVMTAQVVGGLIAGAAGAVEVLGLYARFSWTQLPGRGWTGIIVAILARENPFLVVPAAVFLAYLQVGADVLSERAGIPGEIAGLISAAIMLSMTTTAVFQNPALTRLIGRVRRREAGGT